jgi:glucose/mannose-6-phosphate isomerase
MKIEELKKIDESKMYEIYDKWPEIAKESYNTKINEIDVKDIDHVVFAGMGGSGTIGDVMKSILSKEDIHVNVIKGYTLPNTVDKNTLIVVISVSGNTQETLSILKQAFNSDAKIIAISSGGKIEEFCKEKNIVFKKILMEHSPRASFPRFFFSILNILKNIIPNTEKEIHESISILEKTRSLISSENLNSENTSLKLAEWISNTPVIYYPRGLNSVATRFKNSLQENAKIHVISEELLESCHNGIVAWNENKIFQPILIRGKDDHTKTKERWNIIKEFFNTKNLQFFEINSVEGNILSKIINLIYVTDFATIYFSVLQNIDPSPVKAIDFVKNRLK